MQAEIEPITIAPETFTPSEAVLIHAEMFPLLPKNFQAGKTFTLLDGSSKADKAIVSFYYIAAAIVANVEAGVIQFAVRKDSTNFEELICQPTGFIQQWPKYTLEARLILERETTVQELVQSWLMVHSKDVDKRAFDLGKIMLVVRGHAVFTENDLGMKQTLLTGRQVKLASQQVAEKTKDSISKFAAAEPHLWQLLLVGVTAGMNVSMHVSQPNDGFEEPDPWAAERPEIRERFKVVKESEYQKHSKWLTYAPVRWLIRRFLPVLFTTILVLLAIGGLGFSMWKNGKVIVGFFGSFILLGGIYLFLRQKMVASIKKKVEGPPLNETETVALNTNEQLGTLSKKQAPTTGDDTIAIPEIETITIDSCPHVSPESDQLLEQVHQRKPAVKQLYLKYLILLFAGSTLLDAIYLYVTGYVFHSGTQEVMDAGVCFILKCTLFIFTIVMSMSEKAINEELPFYAREVWSILRSKPGSVSTITRFGAQFSIQARRLQIAGVLTVIFMVAEIYYLNVTLDSLPTRIVFCGIAVSLILLYIGGTQRGRRMIEAQLPYRPPYNLLALRVFGSPHLTNFLNLILDWQYFGTLNRLDGTDTIVMDLRYYLGVLRGKIQDCIVKDEKELNAEFSRMKQQPGKNLLFPVDSMQCTNVTWKEAINRMFTNADVIILDLTNLTEKNQGVSYELKKLITECPLSRTMLLIDDTTDRKVLDKMLRNIYSSLPSTSPNRLIDTPMIQVIHTGGVPKQQNNEDQYDFQKRLLKSVDSRRLVGMVLDKARESRILPLPDPIKDAAYIHWTGFRFSNSQRLAWNILMLLLLLTALGFSLVGIGRESLPPHL